MAKAICSECDEYLMATKLNFTFGSALKKEGVIEEKFLNELYSVQSSLENRVDKLSAYIVQHKKGHQFVSALKACDLHEFAKHFEKHSELFLTDHDFPKFEIEKEQSTIMFENFVMGADDSDAVDHFDSTSNHYIPQVYQQPEQQSEKDFDNFDDVDFSCHSKQILPDHLSIRKVDSTDKSSSETKERNNDSIEYDITDEQLAACQQNEEGNTSYHLAIDCYRPDLLLKLIMHLPDWLFLCVRNKNGQLPIHRAADTKQANCIRDLLRYGSIPDTQDNDGDTPLHIACRKGSLDSVLMLTVPIQSAEKKCHENYLIPYPTLPQRDLNIINKNGLTCLHEAVIANNQFIVEALCKAGADVNCQNTENGWTPLHYAAFHHQNDMVTCLLKNCKANPVITNFEGKTA